MPGTRRDIASSPAARRTGFTLVEMLVVVAIILLLLSLLAPALNNAVAQAERATCMSNLHQCSVAWVNYATDHNGTLVYGQPANREDAFVYRGAGEEPIRDGALFPYMSNIDIMRCPSDPSDYERSYVITGPMRGEGWRGYGIERIDQITQPGQQLVWTEEHDPRGWNIGSWLIGGSYTWIDQVALFHGNQDADTLAFADGHAEYWRWQDEDTIWFSKQGIFGYNDSGSEDWERINHVYNQFQGARK